MQDTVARAARILGVEDAFDEAAVRRAFRAALRRERPDLGAMSADRLAQVMAARDVLLAAGPAPGRPPSGLPGPRSTATATGAADRAGGRPSGPRARLFDVAPAPVAGRLVDVYA